MAFSLPLLPFPMSALEPWTSAETIAYHYGKHHAGYVHKLNAAVAGTPYDGWSLEEIVVLSRGGNAAVFNCAAQHFNHTFFWKCLAANSTPIDKDLARLIDRDFGSLDDFRKAFSAQASMLFGSGWTWLVQGPDGKLAIHQTKDAENPLGSGGTPLLTLDVWEHAYYIDHRNDRSKFIQGFWDHVNWTFVTSNLG